MPTLAVPHAQIYYETIGEQGPWLTFVNGHTRSSRDFRLLAKMFEGQGYRCLLLDNRGAGQTQTDGAFSLDDMVADVVALWNHCGIETSHLVGLSMGGMISQILGARFAARIDRLVLVSTAAHSAHLASLSFEPWGQDLASVVARLKRYLSEAFYQRNKLLIQAMAKQILTAITSENFEARAEAQHAAILKLDNRPLLGAITAPTLIIHGSDDGVIPLAAAEELAGAIAQAQLLRIPGAGHLLLAEDSKGLGQAILKFLAE